MTKILIAPGITGSIKDLQQLWDVDIFDLFGDFGFRRPLQVISLRHGSSFALANRGVLEATGILRNQTHKPVSPFNQGNFHARPTTIHMTFLTPHSTLPALSTDTTRIIWACRAVTAAEIALASALAIIMGSKKIYVGLILMICVLTNIFLLLILRMLVNPVLANEKAIARDTQLGATGGAALDIHLIASTWNSSQIHVICGYSSQVHALTNLPISVNSTSKVKWCCRALAANLVIQAAALTSQVNNNSVQVWGSIIWMAFYLLMLVPSYFMRRLFSGIILDDKSFFIRKLPPMQFSRRRSALAFLAMLPVTCNTDRWDWMDLFVPPNQRRQKWVSEMEKCPLIGDGTGTPLISQKTPAHMSEAIKAFMTPSFQGVLVKYKTAVNF